MECEQWINALDNYGSFCDRLMALNMFYHMFQGISSEMCSFHANRQLNNEKLPHVMSECNEMKHMIEWRKRQDTTHTHIQTKNGC